MFSSAFAVALGRGCGCLGMKELLWELNLNIVFHCSSWLHLVVFCVYAFSVGCCFPRGSRPCGVFHVQANSLLALCCAGLGCLCFWPCCVCCTYGFCGPVWGLVWVGVVVRVYMYLGSRRASCRPPYGTAQLSFVSVPSWRVQFGLACFKAPLEYYCSRPVMVCTYCVR
jgi:hypothetical protein